MKWLSNYQSKRCSAGEAVACIRSGDSVLYGGNAATPLELLRALARRKGEVRDVRLSHVLLLAEDPLQAPGMETSFRHTSLFVGPSDREAVNSGRADYLPVFLHQIPRLFREGIVPLDVVMVMTSPPDEHGYMSLGVENLASKAACLAAKRLIVQVNEKMPRVLGDGFLHVDQCHAFVEHTEALPELRRKPAGAIDTAIAEHVARLIPRGATLQMGIGGVPDSVYRVLDGALDLGIHSEMISDEAMKAIERGTVTGSRKSLHPGKVILTFAIGSTALYEFLDNNPLIESHPVDYVNDPYVASQNDNLVAVNSAIEVDLTGQVCSDSIGATIYSGFGGQVDFIRAATRSRGGKPIIALPSTARSGAESRIVPYLKRGAGVVTSRADVYYVVTEYGAVSLFGKNLSERARALIEIAHPDFRGELVREAKERRLLT